MDVNVDAEMLREARDLPATDVICPNVRKSADVASVEFDAPLGAKEGEFLEDG